jgi:ElaB/YqjD/DUF883 family membrane-anchored ribosome-binding protein
MRTGTKRGPIYACEPPSRARPSLFLLPFAHFGIAFIVRAMSTSTDAAKAADALKAQASEAVRKVGETLNDQANVLRDTAASARYNTQDFIENNPWQSVAIAGAVGFLIGIVIARR